MFWRKYELHDLEISYKISESMLQAEKSKVRIAIVDDEYVDSVADNLKSAGYRDVTPMKNILRLDDVENFDLVLIDIKGIGARFLQGTKSAALEGLSIAREVKRLYPSKKVIVFSAMMKEYEDNFVLHDIVDAYFIKDGDISERNKKIDQCIRERIDPVFLWKKNRALLLEGGVSVHAVAKLESKIVKSILRKQSLPELDIVKVIGDVSAIAGVIKSISELVALTL